MKLAVFLRVKYWNFHPEFYLGGFFCLASLTTVELGGLRDNLVVALRTAACLLLQRVFYYSIKQQRVGCENDLTLFSKLVWREGGMWWCVGSLRLTPNCGRALVRDLSLTSEAPLHPDPLAQCRRRPSNHSSLHTHCPEASATLFCWLPA